MIMRPIRGFLVLSCVVVVTSMLVQATPAGATFPGTNGKILFASTRDAPFDFEIYTMNPDGSDVTRLTTISGDDRNGAFSADGTKIAWSRGGDIWTMNANGTGQTAIVTGGGDDGSPAWSPDGTKILYNSNVDGDYDVYVVNSDGSGTPTNLTTNGYFDCCADFSPDGTTIVYQTAPSGGADYDIYTMNADGSNKTARAANHGSGAYEVSPSWSPNGSYILYSRDFGFGSGWAEIYRMNADGTAQTNLTNSCCAWEFGVYSPDGTKIAYSSNAADPFWEMYVTDAGFTGTPTKLNTNVGTYDFVDDWGIPPGADLSITKSDAPDPVASGNDLTYTITVTNNGPQDATGVTVTDPLPSTAIFRSMSSTQGTCTRTTAKKNDPKDGTVTCAVGSLSSGDSATITIVVRPTKPGTISNTATVTGSPSDPDGSNNTATATTTVVGT
jgi:uncharacterized repeat protein (TIGR01451 family)